MRYYRRVIDESAARRLVAYARERMRALPREVAEGVGGFEGAQLILGRLEAAAPMNDCGMSGTITELDLWTPEAKALRKAPA